MENKRRITKIERFLFNRIVQLKNARVDFKNRESTRSVLHLNMTLYIRLTSKQIPTVELIEKLLPGFNQEI